MKNKPPKLWSIDIISAEINITILVSHFGGLILKKKTWNLKKIDAQNIHHSKIKMQSPRGAEKWTSLFLGPTSPTLQHWVTLRDCNLGVGTYGAPAPGVGERLHCQPGAGQPPACSDWDSKGPPRGGGWQWNTGTWASRTNAPGQRAAGGRGRDGAGRAGREPGPRRQGAGNWDCVPGKKWGDLVRAALSPQTALTKHKLRSHY